MKAIFSPETFLGIGFGLGASTSLRFLGPVGISEILIILGTLGLLAKKRSALFSFPKNTYGIFKIYFMLSMLIILPLATLITFFTQYSHLTDPIYLISFFISCILFITVIEHLHANTLDMKTITILFTIFFLVSGVLGLIFVPDHVSQRLAGFSDNPNQPAFYACSLLILLFLYFGSGKFFPIILVVSFTLISTSDAFTLYIFTVSFIYIFLKIILYDRFTVALRFLIVLFFLLMILAFLIIFFKDDVKLFWNLADEGGTRLMLFINGLKAAFESPIIGHGVGHFSGLYRPFQGLEAHSTPIDLATIFGIPFTLIIYGLVVVASFNFFKFKRYGLVAISIGYLVSGLFHFNGRHFVFWFSMAVLAAFAFHTQYLKEKNKCVEL